MTARRFAISAMSGALTIALALPALAQGETQSKTIPEPQYDSGTSAGLLADKNFNTPESDGRPAVQFYAEGMYAYHQKDYQHAVYMLKVAASWAYKPAEYNLGVMYFQGEGVKKDRPLGAAWMFLAAERGTPTYVNARHTIVTSLDSDERTQAFALLQDMKKTYGDDVALRRAKAQWAFAKANQTGSRVGGTTGELHVGVPALHGAHMTASGNSPGGNSGVKSGWTNVLTGASADGSVVYQQFQQSNNPYDPVFISNRTGTTSVGPLTQVPDKKPVQPSGQQLLWCHKGSC